MKLRRQGSRIQPLIGLVIGMVVAGLVLGMPVFADHLGSTNIASMHDATEDEYVCINYLSGDDSSHNETETRVRGTLYLDTPPSGETNWDELAYDASEDHYRVWFIVRSTACQSLSTSLRNATPIEVWVQEVTENTPPCSESETNPEEDGGNCAWKDGAYVSHVIDGDTHYDYAKGFNLYNDYYIGSSTESLWRHTINHEIGHVLGLLDGDGTCPQSIMHSSAYDPCTIDYPWPQELDINSASARAAGLE